MSQEKIDPVVMPRMGVIFDQDRLPVGPEDFPLTGDDDAADGQMKSVEAADFFQSLRLPLQREG